MKSISKKYPAGWPGKKFNSLHQGILNTLADYAIPISKQASDMHVSATCQVILALL